jgi:hypothetical protein
MHSVFRYVLPVRPVASANVHIGRVGIRIGLVLRGSLEVVGSGGDPGTVRACAMRAVADTASGVMVRGLGTAAPRITSSAGHVFTQLRHGFPATGAVAFAGRCAVDFGRRRGAAAVTVRGSADYALKVTTDGDAARGALASIGVVVLVAVPIAPGRLVAQDLAQDAASTSISSSSPMP